LVAGICAEDNLDLSETTAPWSPLHFWRTDLRQLGGDFVIDREGVVRYEYRSARPEDRPGLEELLEVLGEIENGPN
jgi:hypothetical protein